MSNACGKAERPRLASLAPALRLRQEVCRAIREFFASRGFLETPTPVLVPTPALEDYIDAIPAGDGYLRTSPELHMKRLLAAGHERIFQLGPCFRQGELGSRHLPEFTMLEWYRLHAGYEDLLADTRGLLLACALATAGGNSIQFAGHRLDLAAPWDEITVDAAFAEFAKTSVETALATGAFEALLVEKIEPRLGLQRPTVLRDYPAAVSALSKPHAARPGRVERWELYIGGLEIANACSELTDPAEQRRRFAACRQLRSSQNRAVYAEDAPFLAALDAGMPPAAGIALGLERLLMVLGDCRDIRDITPFPP